MPAKKIPIFFRFNMKWEPNKRGCWEWTSTLSKAGYGKIWYEGKQIPAHRMAWAIHRGPIPKGAMICHICDNPKCVNPLHLYIGDGFTNQQDAVNRKRHKEARKTHCPKGHPYSISNTYLWRNQRACRKCRYTLNKVRYENKRSFHV